MTISKKNFMQFVKYNVGGFLYFWAAWLIITFGTDTLGLWWANIIGNSVGIFLNYLVQRFWTFSDSQKNIFGSGWKFAVLTGVNFVLSYGILQALTRAGLELWFAQFVSAALFTGWNWAWYKWWVFASNTKSRKK